MTSDAGAAKEQASTGLWDQHLASEFGARDTEQTVATMAKGAIVIEVPILVGGVGHEQLRDYYSNHFLNQIPPDLAMKPISRTVGQGRVVDELFISFTHTCRMDFILPGVPPTGKHIELILVLIVQLAEDGTIVHEHLYWDHASVLVQAGLLEAGSLPVVGAEGARQVLTPSHPMNHFAKRS